MRKENLESYIFCAFDNGIFPGCKNRPLEDLRHSDFSHVPGRFLLLVRTKSKIENLVHWKLRPLLVFVVFPPIFSSWALTPAHFTVWGNFSSSVQLKSRHFPLRIFTRNSEVKFYCIKMYPMALTLFHPLSEPAFSASFPQDFVSLRWFPVPNPIKELHDWQSSCSLLMIPILTLERSLWPLKALNPSLLQLRCK